MIGPRQGGARPPVGPRVRSCSRDRSDIVAALGMARREAMEQARHARRRLAVKEAPPSRREEGGDKIVVALGGGRGGGEMVTPGEGRR
jgi:NAD(P)H-hydrate repair Nnr-like enzyme with NAD(P)H-hydrate epimerase domain